MSLYFAHTKETTVDIIINQDQKTTNGILFLNEINTSEKSVLFSKINKHLQLGALGPLVANAEIIMMIQRLHCVKIELVLLAKSQFEAK